MLRLKINDLISEINHVIPIVRRYIEDTYPLENLVGQLKLANHKNSAKFNQVFEITRERPIRTKPSTGDYEPGGQGKHTVYGTISSIIETLVVGPNGRKHIELDGLVSSTVRIVNRSTEKVLADWNFDIADSTAPGCHFHVQARWPDENSRDIWPDNQDSICVPRFPVPVMLPTDALEFLLGELFQESWPKERAKHSVIQQAIRLQAILNWQLNALEKGRGSAWQALKSLKPLPVHNLFF